MRKEKPLPTSIVKPVEVQKPLESSEPQKRKIQVAYIRPDNERVRKLYEQEARDKEEKERQKQTEVK